MEKVSSLQKCLILVLTINNASLKETVGDFKIKVAEKSEMPAEAFRLLFGKYALENGLYHSL
jgi:hypothetical protein